MMVKLGLYIRFSLEGLVTFTAYAWRQGTETGNMSNAAIWRMIAMMLLGLVRVRGKDFYMASPGK